MSVQDASPPHPEAPHADESADDGPLLLSRLSDEELVLLDAAHPLVRLPHHEALAPHQQADAVISAMRGFRARQHSVDVDAQTITLPAHVCDLLDFREAADCVLMTQVVVPTIDDPGTGLAWQHYAFVDDDFVLLEDVTPDGLHDFWALDRAGLAPALQARVPTIEEARDGTGEAVRVDLMAVAAGHSDAGVDLVGRPLVQIDATVWRAPATPEPMLRAVVIGDRGSYSSTSTAGAQGPVTLRPVSLTEVGEEVVGLLTPGTMSR